MILDVLLELPDWLRRRSGDRLRSIISALFAVAFLLPTSPLAVPGRLLWCQLLETRYEAAMASLHIIDETSRVEPERPDMKFPGC